LFCLAFKVLLTFDAVLSHVLQTRLIWPVSFIRSGHINAGGDRHRGSPDTLDRSPQTAPRRASPLRRARILVAGYLYRVLAREPSQLAFNPSSWQSRGAAVVAARTRGVHYHQGQLLHPPARNTRTASRPPRASRLAGQADGGRSCRGLLSNVVGGRPPSLAYVARALWAIPGHHEPGVGHRITSRKRQLLSWNTQRSRHCPGKPRCCSTASALRGSGDRVIEARGPQGRTVGGLTGTALFGPNVVSPNLRVEPDGIVTTESTARTRSIPTGGW